jgi:hypothetical protein
VESPADETGVRPPSDVRALQERLFHEEKCSVHSCGWSAHFVVASEQDGVLDRVKALLSAAGCTVSDERRYEWEPQGNREHAYRHQDPWRGWKPVDPEPALVTEAEPEPVIAESEPVLLPLRPAA